MKEYRALLSDDRIYAERAARVSAAVKDLGEVLSDEGATPQSGSRASPRVAFHSPCTLQHGQKLPGLVEEILEQRGFDLVPVTDAHLCCGSAGTYSLLQSALSESLLDNKLNALCAANPDVIATANIGCYTHLMTRAPVPVVHWIELLDQQER